MKWFNVSRKLDTRLFHFALQTRSKVFYAVSFYNNVKLY